MTPLSTLLRTTLALSIVGLLLAGCDTRAIEAVTDAQSFDDLREFFDLSDGAREGALQFAPDPLRFAQIEVGTAESRTVTLTNAGTEPLKLVSLRLSGSTAYSSGLITRASFTLPTTPLEPGDLFVVELIHAPLRKGVDEAELVATYEMGGVEHEERLWVTSQPERCVAVDPDRIDFRNSVLGQTMVAQVTIHNCGAEPLALENVALEQGSDSVFELASVPQTFPETLERDASRQVEVHFTPPVSGVYYDTLRISTDHPNHPEIAVPIAGTGYVNKCPLAVAGARVRGSSDPFSDQPAAFPLDFLEFSAAGSSDPDGDAIVAYHWSIVQAPLGNTVAFQPNATSLNPELQLAMIGEYVVELPVVDENGMESCRPSQVHTAVWPTKDLIIELVWQTPSDLDETDTCMGCGTDLDLHFKRPGGFWDDKFSHSDCHFRSARADLNAWGAVGVDDNPGLNRDDVDGGGPEQIDILHPAYTDGSQPTGYSEPYEVGVYYYQDWRFEPPGLAHLNVYLNRSNDPLIVPIMPEGIELAMPLTISDPSPAAMGHFWLAGSIDWDANGGTFTPTPPESQPLVGFPVSGPP